MAPRAAAGGGGYERRGDASEQEALEWRVSRQRDVMFRRDAVKYRRGRYARAGPGVQVGVGILTVLVSDGKAGGDKVYTRQTKR